MDIQLLKKYNDERDNYLKQFDELINVDRDEAEKCLVRAEECQRKAEELLGLKK